MTYQLKVNNDHIYQALTNFLWSIRAIQSNEEVVNAVDTGFEFKLLIKKMKNED